MLRHTRRILIAQAPAPVVLAPQTVLNAVSGVRHLVAEPELETPVFEPLGHPATACLVNSPPSVPLFIRRGGLLGVYGNHIANVRSRTQWIRQGVVWRLPYQLLVLTTPFSVLVAPPAADQLYACIVLDGQVDWAVLRPALVSVYTGNALFTQNKPVPKQWRQWGAYTHVSGRGQVGLAGFGTVYRINVGDGEKMTINRNNLLAVTVLGPEDLGQCVKRFTLEEDHLDGTQATLVVKVAPPKTGFRAYIPELPPVPPALIKAWHWVTGAANAAGAQALLWLAGTDDFVEVYGPRTLLVQLGNKLSQPKVNFSRGTEANPIALPPKIAPEPRDYLNVVTIQPLGVNIELKDSFADEAARQAKKTRT